MNKKKILSALIGLAGAAISNGKTENTDSVIITALLSEDSEEEIAKIHKEKYQISPNCETCQSPCGNTSDYDLNKFDGWTGEIKILKEEIIERLVEVAKFCKVTGQLPDTVYQAITYLGYELQITTYKLLLEDLKRW